ncbi:hypothetical protein KC850_01725 [Candidatus Kaiserbacteria bacterium]|nr:hypothetical protein [Candidatus Kaiserbacteria bacterium]MCB9818297.1 hypothetical protein [Candidatus Nomurabacteria bacterium]
MNSFKKAVLETIDNTAISEDRIISSNNTLAKIINLLLSEGVLSEGEMMDRLHKRILTVGRDSYIHHKSVTAYSIYPDHTLSPQCLAHAIVHSELSSKERDGIRYDGQTEVQFIHEYYDVHLPEKLFSQLTTFKETPITDDSWSSCC